MWCNSVTVNHRKRAFSSILPSPSGFKISRIRGNAISTLVGRLHFYFLETGFGDSEKFGYPILCNNTAQIKPKKVKCHPVKPQSCSTAILSPKRVRNRIRKRSMLVNMHVSTDKKCIPHANWTISFISKFQPDSLDGDLSIDYHLRQRRGPGKKSSYQPSITKTFYCKGLYTSILWPKFADMYVIWQ